MIKIFDNKISKEDQNTIYTFCKNKEYFRGENDRPNLPPTGLVSALDDESVINTLLAVTGSKAIKKLLDLTLIFLLLMKILSIIKIMKKWVMKHYFIM